MTHRSIFIRGLDTAIDIFIVINISLITLFVCAQVALRYIFHSPLMGIEELTYFPTTWLYLGGAVKASSEKNQLVARVLELFIKTQKNVYLLRAIAALISSGILLWLTYWGYDLLKYTLRLNKQTDTLFLPWALMEGFMFCAFALMLLYTVIELIECHTAWKQTDGSLSKMSEEVKG